MLAFERMDMLVFARSGADACEGACAILLKDRMLKAEAGGRYSCACSARELGRVGGAELMYAPCCISVSSLPVVW